MTSSCTNHVQSFIHYYSILSPVNSPAPGRFSDQFPIWYTRYKCWTFCEMALKLILQNAIDDVNIDTGNDLVAGDTWANVDPDLCRDMPLMGHNELNMVWKFYIRFSTDITNRRSKMTRNNLLIVWCLGGFIAVGIISRRLASSVGGIHVKKISTGINPATSARRFVLMFPSYTNPMKKIFIYFNSFYLVVHLAHPSLTAHICPYILQ